MHDVFVYHANSPENLTTSSMFVVSDDVTDLESNFQTVKVPPPEAVHVTPIQEATATTFVATEITSSVGVIYSYRSTMDADDILAMPQ